MPGAEIAPDTRFDADAALLGASVREAGALALSMFGAELRNWTKGESSPVSEADIAVNDLLARRLRAATPDYGWLSEESVDDDARLSRDRIWIVDHIDGTRGYLAGRNDWCVSVALVERGRPVLAAVFAPVTDEFFFARRGCGALRNGTALRADTGEGFDFSRMAGPRPLVERLGSAKDDVALYPRIASLALRLCRVADGTLLAAFAGGQSHDWDIAAAHLVVEESCGRMTGIGGDDLLFNRTSVRHSILVAAGQRRHAQIIKHFKAHPLPR